LHSVHFAAVEGTDWLTERRAVNLVLVVDESGHHAVAAVSWKVCA
jgi:hypothetical protein